MKETTQNEFKVLGIDIGGTGIRAAAVDVDTGALLNPPLKFRTPNPSSSKAVIEVISEIIHHLDWKGRIGCGLPGIVKNDQIKLIANLDQDWVGVNLRQEITRTCGCEVRVANDADVAGVAEMRFGAGRNRNKKGGGVVLFITLGTGIGSALFIDGRLVPNTEFGLIEMGGTIAEKRAATVVREKENLSWEEWGLRVNGYLKLIERLLSPDCIILGGGVSENPELFFPYLNAEVEIYAAELKSSAGIIGAAQLFNLNYS